MKDKRETTKLVIPLDSANFSLYRLEVSFSSFQFKNFIRLPFISKTSLKSSFPLSKIIFFSPFLFCLSLVSHLFFLFETDDVLRCKYIDIIF